MTMTKTIQFLFRSLLMMATLFAVSAVAPEYPHLRAVSGPEGKQRPCHSQHA